MRDIKSPQYHLLRIIFIVLVLVITSNSADAQSVKRLKINDTLPDVEIRNRLRFSSSTLKLGEFRKNKVMIINFWATWCVPCVKELTELSKQADNNRDQLSVLSVSYENEETVKAFLNNHPELKNSAIEFIHSDKIFSDLFFHQALPHNVWIDQIGSITAITGGDEINDVNIQKFIRGTNNQMRVKKEIKFDRSKPVHIPDSLITFRSIFTKKLDGVELSGSVISPSKLGKPNATRFFEFNTLIKDMFYNAYQMPGYIANMYLMEVQTKDSTRYFWPGENIAAANYHGITRDQWGRDNQYTYEFKTPRKIADSIFFKHVIADLELNFDVTSYKALRKKACWVVTYNPDSGLINKANVNDKYFLGIVKNQLIISGIPLDYLLDWISYRSYKSKRKEPYLNKTNLKFAISATIELGDDLKSYDSPELIEKCLSEQLGLKFSLRDELYPVLVIKDNQ